MSYRIINLELGYPDSKLAISILKSEITASKKLGYKAIKLIHGYGSSGKGGRIKSAVQKELASQMEMGRIKHFVNGENFSMFCEEGRLATKLCPDLRSDSDYTASNSGITIIILK